MPTPSCVLHTRRPSPTTVSFTVSTRPVRERVGARIFHHALLLLRFLAACEILLMLWFKWAMSTNPGPISNIPFWVASSIPGAMAALVARALPSRYLLPVALTCMWILTKRGYIGMFRFSCYLRSLIWNRGIVTCFAGSRDSNHQFIQYLPIDSHNSFHSYDIYSGYLYSRGL
jgi:hypothetical protein